MKGAGVLKLAGAFEQLFGRTSEALVLQLEPMTGVFKLLLGRTTEALVPQLELITGALLP